MSSKKKLKVFKYYSDAIIHCVNNDIKYNKVCKHESRPNTTYNWFVLTKNGKPLMA